MSTLSPPPDLPSLAAFSARIGADPLLIQGAGGNTSVKADGVMWIKASGTMLADAQTRDIFVPCNLGAMRASMAAGEERADRPAEFALGSGTLRPSIETSLHAVFPHRVVIHVHCVNTIAIAIRPDAKSVLEQKLHGLNWAIVPYAKPGANLARQVMAVLGPETDVVVLANHGLIVAAETVAAAELLLFDVVGAVQADPLVIGPDLSGLSARADAEYSPLPADHPLHSVACTPHQLAAALEGSLYPDHVIFCGIGVTALAKGQTPAEATASARAAGVPMPPFLLAPGQGALMRKDATEGAKALARCLGDVLTRLPPSARVCALTEAENAELLNWDAEKYRQMLNARV